MDTEEEGFGSCKQIMRALEREGCWDSQFVSFLILPMYFLVLSTRGEVWPQTTLRLTCFYFVQINESISGRASNWPGSRATPGQMLYAGGRVCRKESPVQWITWLDNFSGMRGGWDGRCKTRRTKALVYPEDDHS